jgi:hypothetical protein
LYNAYLPKNKHAPRKTRHIEDVYNEVVEEPLPEGRNYLVIEVSGEVLDEGCDFAMPVIKYKFKTN